MPDLVFDPHGGAAAMRRSRALVRLPATLPGAILAAGLAATAVLIALAYSDAFGNRAVWAHAHWTLSALSATLALAVASVRASGRDRIVRAGTLCALILWSTYTALWTIQVAIGRATFPSPADVFALGIIVPAAVVVVATVHGRLSRAEEAAVYIDSALIAAAIVAVLLVLFGPAAYAVGGFGSILAFVYPLEFLAIAGAGAVALVAIRHPIRLRGGFPLLAGSAITGIAYLGWLAPAALGQEASGQLPSPLFSIGTLIVGFGAATWTDETATGPRYHAATDWLSRVVGPTAASITLLGLLRDSAGPDALEPAIHMTVVVAGVLFVIRQGLLLRERSHSLREIRTLHDENDRLVDELRAELIERKRVQDRLVDASRMAAVGELAAGVAHEVNNPLTGVLGFSELLLEDMTPDDPRRADVQSIRSEAIRARSIIRALRDFARPREPQPVPTDMPDLVARTLDLLRYPLERAGVIIAESYAEMPPIDLDPQAIQQVVLNVLTNAMQAMPDGGTLEVETVVRAGEAVITVVDNGVGMDESVAAQAFVPFYSARRTSGATGLGLSVSLGLVESHRGSIRLDSRVGEGTTVEISLPIDPTGDAGQAASATTGSIGQ